MSCNYWTRISFANMSILLFEDTREKIEMSYLLITMTRDEIKWFIIRQISQSFLINVINELIIWFRIKLQNILNKNNLKKKM